MDLIWSQDGNNRKKYTVCLKFEKILEIFYFHSIYVTKTFDVCECDLENI